MLSRRRLPESDGGVPGGRGTRELGKCRRGTGGGEQRQHRRLGALRHPFHPFQGMASSHGGYIPFALTQEARRMRLHSTEFAEQCHV